MHGSYRAHQRPAHRHCQASRGIDRPWSGLCELDWELLSSDAVGKFCDSEVSSGGQSPGHAQRGRETHECRSHVDESEWLAVDWSSRRRNTIRGAIWIGLVVGWSASLYCILRVLARLLDPSSSCCSRGGTAVTSFRGCSGRRFTQVRAISIPIPASQRRVRVDAARKIGQGSGRRAATVPAPSARPSSRRYVPPRMPPSPLVLIGFARVMWVSLPHMPGLPVELRKTSSEIQNFGSLFFSFFFSTMSMAFILESRDKPFIACSGPCGLTRAQ